MKWNILNKANNLKEIMINIINSKNMSKADMLDFINFNIKEHNAYLLTNLDKSIDKIISYIENKKAITIIGDYDVDGICSTMVMYITLGLFTKVNYIIPDRFNDGYGISNKLVDRAKELNTDLIITVDNGIKGHEQVKYAKSLGMDIIITDHHAFEDKVLPCEFTINPNIDNSYPFKNICGCMVAFKLCIALLNKLEINNFYKNLIISYKKDIYIELLEFTCLATIADVMPLVDENRYYVNQAINFLKQGAVNIGLNSLINKLNISNITTNDVAFYIAPCINAAGRLKTANLVMDLFMCEDCIECDKMAENLINLNNSRKEIQKRILDNLIIDNNNDFIIAHIKEDIPGIVGIIAGNIVEKYQKPCFCVCGKEKLHGSGRSIHNYAINKIIENTDFVDGGGHAGACGIKFNILRLQELQNICNEDYKQYKQNNNIEEEIDIVNEINFDLINERLINNLFKLQPFGYGNEEPLFYSKNVQIQSSKIMGKNKNVIKFSLLQNNISFEGIGFTKIIDKFNLLDKNDVEIIYSVNLNEFPKGVFKIQLCIKDIR